ncbi:GIP, partial [Symbiodinium natans]
AAAEGIALPVPVTRANAQETKPWLKGKAKVIKTLPISPYTAKENWDWKEGRGGTGDRTPWTGKTVFKIKEQNKKAFAGAAEERDPVVEHPDPEISAAINEVPPIDIPKEKLKRPGNFPILRSKRMELLPGDFTFPMRSEQLALQESLRKPTLADQDCSWGDTEGAGTRAPPGDSPDEPLPPPGVPDLDGSDLKDRLSEYLDQVAKENEDYVPEDVGAVEDWLGRDAPGSSKAQREADIERFERKKAREAEEDARKALRDSPAMPVIAEPDPALKRGFVSLETDGLKNGLGMKILFAHSGWELIAKVIDMEPAEDHPFAYVFDKKHASPAADYQVRPNRKEDFWEVDAELAAVVRLVDRENIFPYH